MSNLVPRSDTSEFRFRIPVNWAINPYHLGLVYVIGLDGTPMPCKVRVDRSSPAANRGAIVHIARNQTESGHVYFVFPHPHRGELLLSTGTLPVVDETYDLLKELARGTLNRLRNQLSIWQEGGLQVSAEVPEQISLAVHDLAQCIMARTVAEQDELASRAIVKAVDLIYEIADRFGQQISQYRCEHPEMPEFWLGATVPRQPAAIETVAKDFNFARINELEYADDGVNALSKLSMPLILGPWLDASQGGMSKSLIEFGDHNARRQVLLTSLRSTLEQIPNNVRLLHLVSGINGIGHRHLSYPQQLQLVIDLLQLVDESLVEVPVMISFDFPWAERLAGAVGGIHPLQIADSVLRQGVPVSYFGLEVNLDYAPSGSAVRDPFQWIDLIDIWNQLEVPVVILLRAPLGGGSIPADQPVDRLVNQQRSTNSDAQRLEYLKLVLQLLVARPLVHGVIWSQWHDASDPRFPAGGMIGCEGVKAPLKNLFSEVQQLLALRRLGNSPSA